MKVVVMTKYFGGDYEGADIEMFAAEDSKELREELLDRAGAEDYDYRDDFINMKDDSTFGSYYGADWDSPTGIAIEIYDKDILIQEIEEESQKKIKKVESLFS